MYDLHIVESGVREIIRQCKDPIELILGLSTKLQILFCGNFSLMPDPPYRAGGLIPREICQFGRYIIYCQTFGGPPWEICEAKIRKSPPAPATASCQYLRKPVQECSAERIRQCFHKYFN
jgi:hypothetical protein